MSKKRKKLNKYGLQLGAIIFLITVLAISSVLIFPGNIRDFVLAFTEKSSGDPIYESDWNNLDNDFVATAGGGISGNLGIGMASPSAVAKLEINLAGLTTTEGLHISRDAAGYAYLNIEDENASPIFKVHESGNVGIGTASPVGKLDVAGSICFAGDCRSSWATTGGVWSQNGSIIYYNGGNVGIGAVSPAVKLEVNDGTIWAHNSGGGEHADLQLGEFDDNPSISLYQFITDDSGGDALKIKSNRWGGDVSFMRTSAAGDKALARIFGWYTGGATFDLYGDDSENYVKTRITADGDSYFNGGNVGIGTAAPSQQLDIKGTDSSEITMQNNWYNSTAAWINLSVDGPSGIGSGGAGVNPWIAYAKTAGQWFTNSAAGDIAYRNTAGKLLFGTSTGAASMAISGANVGIGTVSPNAPLHIFKQSPVANEVLSRVGTSDDANRFSIDEDGDVSLDGLLTVTGDLTVGGGDIYDASGPTRHYAEDSMYFIMDSNAEAGDDQQMGFAKHSAVGDTPAGGNLLMVIKEAGNVGIGTDSPGHELVVKDSNGGSGIYVWGNSQNPELALGDGASHWAIYSDETGTDDLRFWRGVPGTGNNLMTITDDGKVGIGTASPTTQLDIGTASGYLRSHIATGNDSVFFGTVAGDATISHDPARKLFMGQYSENPTLVLDADGNVGIGTAAPGEKLEVSGNIKLSGSSPAYKITNMVLPTASSDAATKGYVDAAQGGANKSSSLGADMLNSYFDSQGLFTPHSNTCDGTESFVILYSGASVGFCIEKNERSAQHWEDARKICAANGKRLPEPGEWKDACQNAGSLGLSNMTDNWEWASNFAFPMYDGSANGIGAAIFGSGGCGYASWYWVGYDTGYEGSYGFRCVR